MNRLIKTCFSSIALLVVVFVIGACDRWVVVHYVVFNDSDSTIRLSYRVLDSNYNHPSPRQDSIKPNTSLELTSREIISNRVFDPDVGNDSLLYIPLLVVQSPDGTPINKRCVATTLWSYTEESSSSARKELHIFPSDLSH